MFGHVELEERGALTAAVFPGASEVSQKNSICPVQLTTVFSYLYFWFS